MPFTIRLLAGLGMGLFYLSSCQTGQELHYFKSGNNYYRLQIKESSIASKARYMSGFYDEKAVDRYFGEMTQPVEKDTVKSNNVQFYTTNVSDYTSDKLKIDSSKKLVMILSTNSNAVSEQIGAFAENDRILETIMRLSNIDKIKENHDLLTKINVSKARSISTIALGTAFIENLPDSASATVVRTQLSTFLQYLKDQNQGNAATTELLIRNFKKP